MRLIFSVFLAIILMLFVAPVSAQETSGDFSGGSVLIGPDTRACDGSLEGSIRYNNDTDRLEVCNGSNWVEWGS